MPTMMNGMMSTPNIWKRPTIAALSETVESPASTSAAPPLMVVQARAAPRGGRRVAEQGDGDGGDGIKAEGYEEGRRDGGRSARAGRALEEDGEHHADDDELHAAVVADAGNGGLDVVNGAGLAQQVQNGERAEDHEHDLETLFDALPDQRIEGLDVVGKAGAGDVEVGEGQDQRPDKGNGGDPFGGLLEA